MGEDRRADIIQGGDAVQIVRKTLGLVDERLVNHGERVGYMLYQMLRDSERYSEKKALEIFNLGVFHDIGAYKTDEIDKMVKFEADNVWEHSINLRLPVFKISVTAEGAGRGDFVPSSEL